jgi:hypothetical protein
MTGLLRLFSCFSSLLCLGRGGCVCRGAVYETEAFLTSMLTPALECTLGVSSLGVARDGEHDTARHGMARHGIRQTMN